MSLDEKIGQMIMAGFSSVTANYCGYDEHIDILITKYKVGNISLFARNIGSIEEITKLTETIQKNMIEHIGIPAIIGTDQEGGVVTQVREGAVFFPGNMAVAAANIEGSTLKEGEIVGEGLRALGINLNIAPVLDVNNNSKNPIIGVRSYGDDPEQVAKLGVDFIKGVQSRGVIATAKHFPGHGDTEIDTHVDIPTVPYDRERLERVEFYPFRKAVENGVDAIMTAHIYFPAIDDEKIPATLSYNILTKLLRDNMGFKGIIMTDCMEMDAISKNFGIEKGSVMAIKAGTDMIEISHHLDVQIRSVEAIKKAVLNEEIPEERINESVRRILEIKKKYGLFENPYPDLIKAKEVLNCKKYIEFARQVSEKSITLIRDRNKLIPLNVANKKIISISPEPKMFMGGIWEAVRKKYTLCEALRKEFGGKSIIIPFNPESGMTKEIVKECEKADLVIIGVSKLNSNPGEVELVNKISRLGKDVIVILLKNPYDVLSLEDISTCVCAYEHTPLAIESVIKVLKGEIKCEGVLPVKIEI
ncbi:MAG TPA: glycoside hydrolase family 3 protein [Clostridia bacterium]|nr:glycoside hydrolase family 3 protein [Clostridia bacterium]